MFVQSVPQNFLVLIISQTSLGVLPGSWQLSFNTLIQTAGGSIAKEKYHISVKPVSAAEKKLITSSLGCCGMGASFQPRDSIGHSEEGKNIQGGSLA